MFLEYDYIKTTFAGYKEKHVNLIKYDLFLAGLRLTKLPICFPMRRANNLIK